MPPPYARAPARMSFFSRPSRSSSRRLWNGRVGWSAAGGSSVYCLVSNSSVINKPPMNSHGNQLETTANCRKRFKSRFCHLGLPFANLITSLTAETWSEPTALKHCNHPALRPPEDVMDTLWFFCDISGLAGISCVYMERWINLEWIKLVH